VHRRLLPLVPLLALSACKVEETPREFYTQRDPASVERQEGSDEIRTRVRSFAESLARGDQAGAALALGATQLTEVVGVDANGGVQRMGPAGLAAALAEVDAPAPAFARTPDLRVDVSGRGLVGWFSTHLELLSPTGPLQAAQQLRVTGVFQRDRGEWRLAQIHLSRPEAPPPSPAGADSARADGAVADSAGADADSASRSPRP
jgi:ketosteroid isomerase-like protein